MVWQGGLIVYRNPDCRQTEAIFKREAFFESVLADEPFTSAFRPL